jgi:hypothetical protein
MKSYALVWTMAYWSFQGVILTEELRLPKVYALQIERPWTMSKTLLLKFLCS